MQITNFNAPAEATPPPSAPMEAPAAEGRDETELALLRARIEHLELVVDTARSLMTANQEKLLRRLHDVPQEMMALTARLSRMGGTDDDNVRALPIRRTK